MEALGCSASRTNISGWQCLFAEHVLTHQFVA